VSVSASVLQFPETARVLATLLVGLCGWLLTRAAARMAAARDTDLRHRREQRVWSRNLVLVLGTVAMLGIWGSKIAGFALALTAVAGAALIVSKDLLASLLGTAALAMTRPFRVDDFVELAGVRGRVVGTGLLATTLAETLDGHQLTGKTVSIPNAALLTQPVRNDSATGQFLVQLVRVGVPADAPLETLEACLLEAAHEVCAPWLEAADAHLARVEARHLIDLPSATPRVLLSLQDAKQAVLALRYVCRANERVNVEQDILRRYGRKARAAIRAGRSGEPQA
jgi:small-conductance mechanosensitive channel